MIIGDDFKWDKLIVVCYPGGFGGDFFCNLLQMNYDPNHTFSSDKNNKFEWYAKQDLTNVILIKKINVVFKYYQSIKEKYEGEFYNKELIWHSDFLLNKIKKITHILYDDDYNIFKNNYIQFIRNAIYEQYLQKKYIINTHFLFNEYININELFPRCLNIFLFSKKYEYVFLNLLLGRIKNFDEEDKLNLLNFIEPLVKENLNFLFNSYDNLIEIDVGKLFFENNNYIIDIEYMLSNKLNIEIKLDKAKIKKYKKANMNILGKTFDIENAHELMPKELLENIVKKYGNCDV